MGKRKNATEEFEDVDEPEIEDEEEEQHSSDISPPIIREFTEIFQELLNDGTIKDFKVPQLSKKIEIAENEKIKKFLKRNDVDFPSICTAFHAFFNKALTKSKIEISLALELTKKFSASGEAISLHPRFPKNVPNKFSKFLSDNNKSFRNATSRDREKYHEQKDTMVGDMKELYKRYAKSLETFMKEETELTPEQKKYVETRIRTMEKKYKPAEPTPKKKGKAAPQPVHRTAYDFYKMTKTNDYTDMDGAERDAKLLKKFRKLSDEQKQIFQMLEQNQNL